MTATESLSYTLQLVELPSGATGAVAMIVTVGDLAIALLLVAVLLTGLYGIWQQHD